MKFMLGHDQQMTRRVRRGAQFVQPLRRVRGAPNRALHAQQLELRAFGQGLGCGGCAITTKRRSSPRPSKPMMRMAGRDVRCR